MRTTLTLDDSLLQTLKKRAAEQNISFKEMVHQAMQKGLESMEKQSKVKRSYCTPVRSLGQRPGYDLDTLGRIAEEQTDHEAMDRSQ